MKWTLLALCLVRLWIIPLPSSFWVDETATLFVVRQGAHHPSFAAAPQVPASLYFWLPRAAERFLGLLPNRPGVMETVYRFPSVLAMAVALFLVARIAQRLIHPRAGWFAVFACLALRGFDYEAANARPYALGVLVVCASAYFLIRWLDGARAADAALFVLFAASIWRVHLLFWPFYLVLLGYALTRLARSETKVPWNYAAFAFGLVGITLIPVFFDALALSRHAGEHVIAPVPPLKELLRELKFGLLAVSVAAAWALRIGAGKWTVRKLPTSTVLLMLAWWLVPPIALFALSAATGNSVFVHRYLSFALPGAALAATAAAAFFLPEARWSWAAALLGGGVLLLLGDWQHAWPPHHNSDWRTAAASINVPPDVPIVCPSPFIEARSPAWTPGYALPGFLYAHLAAYPIHGKLVLLPFQSSSEAEWLAGHIQTREQFVLYGPAPSVELWRAWYLKQPQFHGWTARNLGDFGDVSAFAVSKP